MAYRILLLCFSIIIIAHCGKPHRGKAAQPLPTITAPQDMQGERDDA